MSNNPRFHNNIIVVNGTYDYTFEEVGKLTHVTKDNQEVESKFESLLSRPTPDGVLDSPLKYSPTSNYGAHGAVIGAAITSTGTNKLWIGIA